MIGYLRPDGRIGIRNHVAVIYTVKCAEHVARKIREAVPGTQVFGYDSCYPDPYGGRIIVELARHPNVAAVLFVSLGCESSPVQDWLQETRKSGKRAECIVIQRTGGTLDAIAQGAAIAAEMVQQAATVCPQEIGMSDLVIGVECGGSDATSGLAANPAVGCAVDMAVEAGAACIFSELPELLGTEQYLLDRAEAGDVREKIVDGLRRADELCDRLRTFAVSAGNETSGLTTIEEKSLGALCKSGTGIIRDVLKTGQKPCRSGLYLLDKVGDPASNQLTIYEESDDDGFAALLASGAQLIVFTTGCGSVAGSVAAPVMKVCGNPRRAPVMSGDLDIDASVIITGEAKAQQVGEQILRRIEEICSGDLTCAEQLGHEEYHILRKFPRAGDVACADK